MAGAGSAVPCTAFADMDAHLHFPGSVEVGVVGKVAAGGKKVVQGRHGGENTADLGGVRRPFPGLFPHP